MTNLYCYKDTLFQRSKKLSRIRNILLFIELILLVSAIIPGDDWIIKVLLLCIALIHISSEYLKHIVKRSNMLAFKFDKIIRLKNSYGDIPSKFELADLKSESIAYYKKLKECLCEKSQNVDDYNVKNNSTHEKELLSRLQEDAFWNHHQYQKMFTRRRAFITRYIAIPLLILMFSLPILFENDYIKEFFLNFNFHPIKLIFIFLSFGLLYEIIDEMINYHRASIEMNEIDNEITRLYEKKNPIQNAMALMVKFHFVRAMCPYIDGDIYITYGEGLNKAWNLRVSQSLNNAFDIFINKLMGMEEEWAITGGINLYFREKKENTRDIDIITTKEGIIEIVKRLDIKIDRIEYQEIKNLRSYFIQYSIEGVCIDIMANPEYKLNGEWNELHWQDEIVDLKINDTLVKTTSIEYEKFTQTIICKQKINDSIKE